MGSVHEKRIWVALLTARLHAQTTATAVDEHVEKNNLSQPMGALVQVARFFSARSC